eukprot:1500943-Karenia_brevis.AAC.1
MHGSGILGKLFTKISHACEGQSIGTLNLSTHASKIWNNTSIVHEMYTMLNFPTQHLQIAGECESRAAHIALVQVQPTQ